MTAIEVLPAPLLYGRLLRAGPEAAAEWRRAGGSAERLPLARWLGPADEAEAALLERAAPPVLDIGCGPGRHLAALREAGREALGLDLSPVAVEIARGRGSAAKLGSVFGDVPRAGTWRSALLLDGNIGIGGAPTALLRRTRELLAPGGVVLVELDPPGAPSARSRVRLEAGSVVSEWFAWASLAADGVDGPAVAAGFAGVRRLRAGGRWFAELRAP
jgi:SAM-dependent methyltransferase